MSEYQHDVHLPSYRAPRRGPGIDAGTRRLVGVAGTLGGILALFVGAWSLSGRQPAGGVPVIEADQRPLRVKPADPGGMRVTGAEEDYATDETAGQLAPPPEKPAAQKLEAERPAPLDRLPDAETPAPLPQPAASEVGAEAADAPSGPGAALSGAPASPPAAGPAALRTPAPAMMGAPGTATTVAPEAASGPGEAVAPSPGMAVAPSPGMAVAPSPATRPVIASSRIAPVPPRSVAGGEAGHAPAGITQVQLAALPSEQAAYAEWQRLLRRAPDLLGGRRPVVLRAERDGRVVYRLRTGGFAAPAEAASFCERMRAKGGGCSIASF